MAKRQRFRAVKYLIKKSQEMGIAIGIEEDDNIKAFRAYKAGDSTTYKTTPVNRLPSRPISLRPFCAYDVGAGQVRYAAKMSGRSFAAMAQNSITEAKLKIDTGTDTANSQAGQVVTGYAPAKANLFVGTGTTTTPKSGILLREYKKKGGTSYTYPFGRGLEANEQNYPQMCGVLLLDLGRGNRTVSFKPERAA